MQLGADHPHTASSLNNLAVLYYYQHRFAEAESLLIRALAICEQTLANTGSEPSRYRQHARKFSQFATGEDGATSISKVYVLD